MNPGILTTLTINNVDFLVRATQTALPERVAKTLALQGSVTVVNEGLGAMQANKKAFQLIKDLFIAIFKRNTNLVISVHIHITKEKISERRDKRC